jgi:hypothetical protein
VKIRAFKEVKAFGEGGVGRRSAELEAPLYLEGSQITRDERDLITSTVHLRRYGMPWEKVFRLYLKCRDDYNHFR